MTQAIGPKLTAAGQRITTTSNISLVDILRWRAEHQPQQSAYQFLPNDSCPNSPMPVGANGHLPLPDDVYPDLPTSTIGWSYAELLGRASAIATQLNGFANQPVLLAFPTGLDFVAAFFGCLQAGAIAVPVPLPGRHQGLARWQHVVADAQPGAILTTSQQLARVRSLVDAVADKVPHPIACMSPPLIEDETLHQPWNPAISMDDIALLQYTSGSTSQPRGVMVSHHNLMHNLALIYDRFGHSPDSYGVIWLPPHHDMGLIGGILQPLYGGFPVTLMSPDSLLRQPIRWLQAISKLGGTTSGGPNFAYERCLQRITPEQRRRLDLSRWELAFIGAEPVRAGTLEQFAATFSECGFRAEAFYPCYGLAEATLFVSGGAKLTQPATCSVERTALVQGQVVDSQEDGVRLVSCGQAAEQVMVIVDPQTHQPCGSGQVGEIWLAGPSIAQGYWQQAQATQETFKAELADGTGPFLRTGDLGFLRHGELFVTGRIKDLMIIRGQNHYPQDIEQAIAQSHAAVQAQPGAAFSLEIDGVEKLIAVQEVKRTALRSLNADAVIDAIRSAVSYQHGLQVHTVVLLKPGSVPKTTSGKVQRHACKAAFQNGTLNAVSYWSLSESASKPIDTAKSGDEPGRGKWPFTPTGDADNQPSVPSASKGNPVQAEALVQWLRQYASESINSRLMDERRCISPGVVLDFGNQGLLGMQVPNEYAGLGLGHRDLLRVLEQLGAIDPTLALFVGLNNVLGIRPILQSAPPDFQADWLPRLATGRELAAFALTEPGAGSNPNAIQSRVVGDGTSGWQLYGEKIWSGSAAWAGIINVFVQHPEAAGISGFAIRKGTAGLSQGTEALTMGMRGMVQNTVYLEGVPVSETQLLGQPGQGMAIAQDAMRYGRLAIASACIGGMKRCAQLMLRYSSRRSVSTGRLLENPVLLTRLGRLTAQISALSALVGWIAQQLDEGKDVQPEAYTACKILAPEFYWQAADDLVQCLGGRGYIETNLAPQILRDARVLRIFEGPTETLAMHLGAQMFHPRSGLKTLIHQDLGAPELAERLFAGAEEILARYQRVHADTSTAHRWAYLAIGELGAIALLLAAQQPLSTASSRAITWTQLYFEQKLAQALVPTASEIVAASATVTAEWVTEYTDAIGDIEQSLAGEEHDLDALLKKEPVSSEAALPNDGVSDNSAYPHGRGKWPFAPTGFAPGFGNVPTESISECLDSQQPEVVGKPRQSFSSIARSLEQWLVRWLAHHLSLAASDVDTNKAFADYGVDSVMAVELAQELEELLDLKQPLDATLAWNFPTITTLAAHLATFASSQNTRGASAAEGNPPSERISLGVADASAKLQALDDLSEAEMADVLAAELAALQGRRR
ncbi:MAG: AMP-binding protein [Synechococcales bacterium]|nr:AMP-binding protein [Synechococcales bacterium]